jgi:hypothetical protein
VTRVGDECALAVERLLEAVEHRVEGLAEPRHLVVGAAHWQALPGIGLADLRGTKPHGLNRPQRGGCDPVARERRQQERHRPADQEEGEQAAEGLLVVLHRSPDDNRQLFAACPDRGGEETDRLALLQRAVTLEEEGVRQRSLELLPVDQGAGAQLRGPVDHPGPGIEDLGEALALLDQRPASGLG